MHEKFITHTLKKKLFERTDNILLAISGGKDSMAMAHLFLQHNLLFGIAHCNFKLRGQEAELDTELVKKFAKENNIKFYYTEFATEKYALEKGISIQMAARDLRYNWFDKISEENNYKYIATAHHKNDVAETMIINLTKGTGLAGLHGIKSKMKNIIRPLLNFSRKEIENYVNQHQVPFREDKSNADTKYTRNLIRHKVIPELEKINPAIVETLNKEANQFLEIEQLLELHIEKLKKQLFQKEGNCIKIELKLLKEVTPLATYLYYLFSPYGFNKSEIIDLVKMLNGPSGKRIISANYHLIKDRNYLLLQEEKEEGKTIFTINTWEELDKLPIKIEYSSMENAPTFEINSSKKYAYLNQEKITFPITLRKWKEGDKFCPLGMKKNKKLSDFFIDNKLSLIDKKSTWILTSNNQIIWVVGHRIDNNYRIETTTQSIVQLKLVTQA